MTADDILYSPIIPSIQLSAIDQMLLSNVALAMGDPSMVFTFPVEKQISLGTYRKIANTIENDPVIFKTVRRHCANTSGMMPRPAGSLALTELMERLHKNPANLDYYWTCRRSAAGVEMIRFSNHFTIVMSIPTIRMSDGRDYEIWLAGLMSNFTGYQGYYAFADPNDAQKFWSTP